MRWFRLSFTIDLTNATAMLTAGGRLGAGGNSKDQIFVTHDWK
jgi:hypothetical protein